MTVEPFWEFSVVFYARPGVSAACIALQDRHSVDVNMLLYALWCAHRGRMLDLAHVATLDTLIARWRQQVVRPVRQARRALKASLLGGFDSDRAAALRQTLLDAELTAERLQQGAMAVHAPDPGDTCPGDAARRNLDIIVLHGAIPADAGPLQTLLAAFDCLGHCG